MKKIWKNISSIGVYETNINFDNRLRIITNQIHFISLLLLVAIAMFLAIMREVENSVIGVGSYRVFLMIVIHIAGLLLAANSFHRVSKFALIYLPPIIILIIPSLIGFVEQESITYYSYAVITFSIIPQLICDIKNEKYLYWSATIYYLILLIIIEPIIIYFSPAQYPIFKIIDSFYLYFRVPQFVIFLFINFSIFYLRLLNQKYEADLSVSKKNLTSKANQLKRLNKMLDMQNVELRQVNSDLKKMKLQLIQSEKMASLGTLVAGVAHEINNPLNAIYGGMQLMKNISEDVFKSHVDASEDNKKECENAMYMIESGFEKTNSIVKTLLNFAHRKNSEKEYSDINYIIDSTLLFLNQKIPSNTNVFKNYELNKEVPVYSDRMHQVFLNLLDNGFFALRDLGDDDEKWVKITTSKIDKNNEAVIVIENNGPHIPEDIISKIFDPFYTTKDPGVGTGLGLAISYKIINEHGGSLTVANSEKGVEFKITIPL